MRMWDIDDLAMVGGLADLHQVHNSTMANWVIRYADFPAPIVNLGGHNIYSIRQVHAWKRARTVRKGM